VPRSVKRRGIPEKKNLNRGEEKRGKNSPLLGKKEKRRYGRKKGRLSVPRGKKKGGGGLNSSGGRKKKKEKEKKKKRKTPVPSPYRGKKNPSYLR